MKKFFDTKPQRNEFDSNLTELNAADSVNTGFMNHNDWVAHVVRYGHAMDLVRKEKATTILDVGCGRLQFMKYMWRNRSTFTGAYTGIDLRATEKWLDEIGWDKGDINLVKMDIINGSLPSELPKQYDIVICTEVLEHVPQDKAQDLLNNLYAWVRPGGLLMLSSPNAGVSDSTADNHKDADGNSREWTLDGKIELGENAGFTLSGVYGTFAAISRLPETFLNDPIIERIREFVPYSWFTVFAAAAFPEYSNNATLEFRK